MVSVTSQLLYYRVNSPQGPLYRCHYVCSTDLGAAAKIKIFVLKYNLGFFVQFVSWQSLIVILMYWNWQPNTRGHIAENMNPRG